MGMFDDIRKDLPTDPGKALLTAAERAFAKLNAKESKISADDCILTIAFLRAMNDRYGLGCAISFADESSHAATLQSVVLKILSNRKSLLKDITDREVEQAILEFESMSGEETFGLARLNEDEKKRLHHNIDKLREIVGKSDLSDRKKNALYGRLNDLAREVDSIGTKTDRFFAFAGDIAFVLGDMATKSKPLLDEVKDMIRTVSRARSRQEGVSLPGVDEVLSLPEYDKRNGEDA